MVIFLNQFRWFVILPIQYSMEIVNWKLRFELLTIRTVWENIQMRLSGKPKPRESPQAVELNLLITWI